MNAWHFSTMPKILDRIENLTSETTRRMAACSTVTVTRMTNFAPSFPPAKLYVVTDHEREVVFHT